MEEISKMFDEELPPVATPDQEDQPEGEVEDPDAEEEEDEEIDEQAEAGMMFF